MLNETTSALTHRWCTSFLEWMDRGVLRRFHQWKHPLSGSTVDGRSAEVGAERVLVMERLEWVGVWIVVEWSKWIVTTNIPRLSLVVEVQEKRARVLPECRRSFSGTLLAWRGWEHWKKNADRWKLDKDLQCLRVWCRQHWIGRKSSEMKRGRRCYRWRCCRCIGEKVRSWNISSSRRLEEDDYRIYQRLRSLTNVLTVVVAAIERRALSDGGRRSNKFGGTTLGCGGSGKALLTLTGTNMEQNSARTTSPASLYRMHLGRPVAFHWNTLEYRNCSPHPCPR